MRYIFWILLAGFPLGIKAQGMLGKRLSADVYMGVAPKLLVVYAGINDGPNSVSMDDRKAHGYTTWNFSASINYVTGKRWEATLGLFGWRDHYVIQTDQSQPVLYMANVPVTVSYHVRLPATRMPISYFGSELSWKYYPHTFNSSETAPAGFYYRIGCGATRFSAKIDREVLKENISIGVPQATVPPSSPNGKPTPVPFPFSDAQAADLWLSKMNMTELKSVNFHIVYGVGYQRFIGDKLYSKVGLEGRAPFFILNEFYKPLEAPSYNGGGPYSTYRTNKEYFQEEAIRRARVAQTLMFTFGVGYMLR